MLSTLGFLIYTLSCTNFKKSHPDKLIWSHSILPSLVKVPQVNSAHSETELASWLTYRTVQNVFALSN